MSNRSMDILVFTAFYLPGYKGGGPIKTIKNLVNRTDSGIHYNLVTGDRDFGDSLPYVSVKHGQWNQMDGAEVFYIQPGVKGYKQIIEMLDDKKDYIVYLNSFFSPRFSLFPLLIAKAFRQKIILGPRGEFSKGALSLKPKKKYVFISFYKLLGLHRGVVYQASSIYEVEDIKRVLGVKVDIQIAEDIGGQEFAKDIPLSDKDCIKAVFISRISPKKNILLALNVLKNVESKVSYDIYGPIEDQDYWAKCESVIANLPSNIQVNYKGELYPEEVVDTLSSYDLFFMPTKGENYGHVIAEALCAGLPVLISDTTPWRNLSEQGLGWDLSLDNPNAFSDVINKLALISKDDHHEMRKTVLAWAKDKFSQRDAIDANIAMFEYVANK